MQNIWCYWEDSYHKLLWRKTNKHKIEGKKIKKFQVSMWTKFRSDVNLSSTTTANAVVMADSCRRYVSPLAKRLLGRETNSNCHFYKCFYWVFNNTHCCSCYSKMFCCKKLCLSVKPNSSLCVVFIWAVCLLSGVVFFPSTSQHLLLYTLFYTLFYL